MTNLSAKAVHRLVAAGEQALSHPAISSGELGFVSRTLISACLPRSRTEKIHYLVANGKLRFSMLAPAEIGLPYGANARLIVLFLVVRVAGVPLSMYQTVSNSQNGE